MNVISDLFQNVPKLCFLYNDIALFIYYVVQETFQGVEDEHKRKIIARAGTLHRTFRTILRSLAKDSIGNYSAVPPCLYAHLSSVEPYWKQFVENLMKEEFMVYLFSIL